MIIDDVCTRLDVLANDVRALEDFGNDERALDDKVRLAVEDWLQPLLGSHGYNTRRHRARVEPAHVWTYTGGAWSDATVNAQSRDDSFNLATVLAAPATDAIYVGLDRPFTGLFVSLVDTVNSNAIAASLTYWNGQWSTLGSSLTNQTLVDGVPFARAGRLGWPTPTDWLERAVNNEGPHYWVRLQVNSAPSACVVEQVLPIVRSRLTQPTALHALALLYREGAGSSRGEWLAKAEAFEKAAAAQFNLVVGSVADEFDVDADGTTEAAEVNSIAREPWTWDRG